MSLMPFAVIWAFLAMAVLGLALYRKLVTRNEDDYVHVADGEARLIPQQIATAHKLDVIDHWEKILMIVTLITGVLLGCAYLYQLWVESQRPLG